MINIRNKLFETNSSSVHALTLIESKDYDKWCAGGYYLNFETGEVLTREEAIKLSKKGYDEWLEKYPNTDLTFPDLEDKEAIEEILKEERLFTSNTFDIYTEEYEVDEDTFSKGDSEYVVLSYFGYD